MCNSAHPSISPLGREIAVLTAGEISVFLASLEKRSISPLVKK
jgi:hypothetical protein